MARIFNITFSSAEVHRLSQFWQAATGYSVVEERDDLVRLSSASGAPDLLILHSERPDRSAGRMHIDLAAAEIARLVHLGATVCGPTGLRIDVVVCSDAILHVGCVGKSGRRSF